MNRPPFEILVCLHEDGTNRIEDWLTSLDITVRARIRVRIDRIEDGNFGDVEPIGDGLSELRIDLGPGYRVYFGQIGAEVHLICGGSKATQARDIAAARKFWRTHE